MADYFEEVSNAIKPETPFKEAQRIAKEENEEQRKGNFMIWWTALFFVIATLALGLSLVSERFFFPGETLNTMVLGVVAALVVSGVILFLGHDKVPEDEVWIITFFGKFKTLWYGGLHFAFPLSRRREPKVPLGDKMLTIVMDSVERKGISHSEVQFLNVTAPVTVEFGYRIFSPYRSVFLVKDLIASVTEILDRAIRTYFSSMTHDLALQQKDEITWTKIAPSSLQAPPGGPQTPASSLHLLKRWGFEIISITVDVRLPREVEEERKQVLLADIRRNAAIEDAKTALVEANNKLEVAKVTAKKLAIDGKAEGGKEAAVINQIAEGANVSPQEAIGYLKALGFYKAMEGKGVVITTPGSSDIANLGAQFAAAQKAVEDLSGSKPEGGK